MKISAFPILSMKFMHDYFLSGKWRGLTFAVADASNRTMAAHGLKLHALPHGFTIVRTQRDLGARTAALPLRAPFQVRIHMHASDPYFFNYTALPQTEMRLQSLYFSNLGPLGESRQGIVSANAAVSAADYLPTHPAQFAIETEAAPGTPVLVTDAHRQQVAATMVGPHGLAEIDLSHHDLGCYGIQIGTAAATDVVTTAHWGQRPSAIIDLHFDPAADDYQGRGESQLSLQFEAREIFWRYNVQLGKVAYAANTVVVLDPDQHIAFGPAELVVTDDEQQLHIISADKVRLQERYPFSLELVQATTNLVLANRLPFPDFRNFKKHPAKQGEYLAETFLSL
jgi:hypothetical protein